ncbi:ribokinase [Primorskyibacter flagellatus]|uniref:Ribokinase n=1 Tax=Primorskyibacter flagellatus TaxID=1387277 RepID=A0A1W2E8K7_9RHOB|nr:ribokinase [Primorskyibacter flagellatus]SMD05985.1 ribokinase [Primorskyibacter flagellatus]
MITVFGSLNADLCFDIARCPDAGETLASDGLRTQAGGKGGNQALAAAKAGAAVRFVGAVGADTFGDVALSGLQQAGVDLSGVRRDAAETGCAIVIVEKSGDNRIILNGGANAGVSADQLTRESLQGVSNLVMQMEIPATAVAAAVELAGQAGVRSIVNLAPAMPLPLETLKKIDLLVVNESEAQIVSEIISCASDAASLAHRLGTDVIRTLGPDGAEACVAGTVRHAPGRAVRVVDTTAAGDCFIGVLAAELDAERDFDLALQRAVAASALTCTGPGSQSSLPSAAEVDAFLATWAD